MQEHWGKHCTRFFQHRTDQLKGRSNATLQLRILFLQGIDLILIVLVRFLGQTLDPALDHYLQSRQQLITDHLYILLVDDLRVDANTTRRHLHYRLHHIILTLLGQRSDQGTQCHRRQLLTLWGLVLLTGLNDLFQDKGTIFTNGRVHGKLEQLQCRLDNVTKVRRE